jgi:hypothetical protein
MSEGGETDYQINELRKDHIGNVMFGLKGFGFDSDEPTKRKPNFSDRGNYI